MKKIFIFLSFIFLFTYLFNIKEDKFYSYFSFFKDVEFCYVVNGNYNIEKQQNNALYTKIEKNGTKKHLYFKNNIKLNIKPDYKQAVITSSTMQNKLQKILEELNIKILFKEKLKTKSIMYGFSSSFRNYKIFKNYKVNFQFVLSENKIIVGHPMIYTGF